MTSVDRGEEQNGRFYSAFLQVMRDTGLDAVSCILMAVGIMLSFDQLFRFHCSVPVMIFHAMLLTAVFILLTRRVWLLPAVIGGILLLILFFSLITGSIGNLFSWVLGLLEWWSRLFPSRSPYNTAGNIALVQFLVHLGIVALLYFCVRLVRSVWIIGIASAMYFAIVASFGFTGRMFPAILLVLIGLLPLIARNYFPLVDMGVKILASRYKLQAAALAVCCVCCMLAAVLLPADTTGWKVLGEDAQLRPIRDPSGNILENIIPSNLHSIGLQPNMDRLGGDIVLGDNTPVMRVKLDEPRLMKSNIYDGYTGSGWTASDIPAYTWNAGDRNQAEKAFGWYLQQEDAQAVEWLTMIFPPRSVEVVMLQRTSSLFTLGSLQTIQTANNQSLLYNERGELFAETMLYSYDSYRFTALDMQRTMDNNYQFDTTMSYLERTVGNNDLYYDEFYKTYTALPRLPENVKATAYRVVGEESSPYRQAVLLQEYLQNGEFQYTLTPGSVPRNRDFVDYFLETKQGYCTYFASAMTVMARTLGIPARLVSGYGLQYRDENGDWVALQKNAHAWVECYFYGIGWIAFDPTAGSSYLAPSGEPVPGDPSPGGSSPGGDSSNPWGTSPVNPPVTAPGGNTTTSDSSTTVYQDESSGESTDTSAEPPIGKREIPPWLIPLMILLTAVILLILLLIWRVHRHLTRYQLEWVCRRFRDNAARAAHYYMDMLHQLALLGYVPQAGETLVRFVTRMAGDDTIPDEAVRQAFGIVMDWKYGERLPEDEDIRQMAAAHEQLENSVRKKLRAVPYFFRRVLLG